MSRVPAPKTADDVFCDALRILLERGNERAASRNPLSPHSAFGRGGAPLLEATNIVLDVGEPGSIRLGNPVRNASHFRSLGMAAWNLAASSDLHTVAFYNPNARAFSDNGVTLRAPWGARLLDARTGRSPLAKVLDELAADPSAMRAVASVYGPEDVAIESRDVPCLLNLCFAVSDDTSLHVTAIFRALNAFGVLPYDHALIVCLAVAAQAHLDLESVRLTYFVRSLHAPLKERPLLTAALEAHESRPEPLEASIGGFWRGDIDVARQELAELEPGVRQRLQHTDSDLRSLAHQLKSGANTWAGPLLAALVSACLDESAN